MAEETYVKVTKDMAYNLDQVSKSLEEISTLSGGVLGTFVDLTKTSTAAGQAWVAIGRFFSGTAFWKVQNRVKAFSNILQFQEKMNQKRLKIEQERTQELAKFDANLKTVLATRKGLDKVIDGTANHEERLNLMGSKYFKVLKSQLGPTQALLKLRERTVDAEKKATEFQESLAKGRNKEVKTSIRRLKNLEDELGMMSVLYDHLPLTEYMEKQKEIQDNIAAIQKDNIISRQNLLDLNDKQLDSAIALMDAQAEEKILLQEIKDLKKSTDEEDQKTYEKVKQRLDDLRESINKSRDELTNAGVTFTQKADFSLGRGRLSRQMVTELDTSGVDNSKTVGEQMLKFLKLDKIYKAWEKRHELKKWIFQKKNNMYNKLSKNGLQSIWKGFRQFIGKGLLLMLQAFLVIGLIVITLIALKQMGFFEWFGMMYNMVSVIFADIWSTAMEVFTVFGEFVGAIFTFIYSLFDPNGDAMSAGLALMLKLGELLVVVGKLGWKLFTAFSTVLWGVAVSFFMSMWEKVKEGGMGGFVSFVIIVTALVGLVIAGQMAAAIFGSNAMIAGVVLAVGAIFGAFDFFSNGGVTSTPYQVVGEKGPELVKLPKGSRVHSNSQSQSMVGSTNNITVNVQGRIGASDSELRDIASKVGKMISTEINRSTTSRTRV